MIKLFEQWLNEENSRLTKKVKKHFDQKLQGLGYNTPDFQWTLMTWLKYALHDANFHDEAKKVEGFFPKAKKSKLVGSPIEKVQQDEGEEIAKWADWDGHDIIDAFVKYMDTIYLEKIGANIQTLKESVNEKKEEGLIFNPSSQKDLNKMRKALEDSNLYAEFDKKEGYFLFPEDSDRYDELEAEIEELTRLHDISGYIESI